MRLQCLLGFLPVPKIGPSLIGSAAGCSQNASTRVLFVPGFFPFGTCFGFQVRCSRCRACRCRLRVMSWFVHGHQKGCHRVVLDSDSDWVGVNERTAPERCLCAAVRGLQGHAGGFGAERPRSCPHKYDPVGSCVLLEAGAGVTSSFVKSEVTVLDLLRNSAGSRQRCNAHQNAASRTPLPPV